MYVTFELGKTWTHWTKVLDLMVKDLRHPWELFTQLKDYIQ